MGRWILLLVFWGTFAQAKTPTLASNLFWSRPCAALLASFFETLPPLGRKRVCLESTQCTASSTIERLLTERFNRYPKVNASARFIADSEGLSPSVEEAIGNRLSELKEGLKKSETLVGIYDGEDRISAFLDRFYDKTEAYAHAGSEAVTVRERVLASYFGQVCLGACAALGVAQTAMGTHNPVAWTVAGIAALVGLRMPFDYAWRLGYHRDGNNPKNAKLPEMFEKAYSIGRSATKAPEWLYWGTGVRLSLSTLEEIWNLPMGDFAPPALGQGLALDDHINTMTFLERWRVRMKLARLKKLKEEVEASLPVQAFAPEGDFDFLLLKSGTAGLPKPRLIVTFRLPEWANEGNDDDGDGGPADYSPDWDPSDTHSPQPVGSP
ncbi:hypothetical protein K2X33_03060 [bacterium]|nr:hypothetical protein [bacterium]